MELNNLNQVDECFKLLRGEVVHKEEKYREEIRELKLQINTLKAKLEGQTTPQRLRLSDSNCSEAPKPFNYSQSTKPFSD